MSSAAYTAFASNTGARAARWYVSGHAQRNATRHVWRTVARIGLLAGLDITVCGLVMSCVHALAVAGHVWWPDHPWAAGVLVFPSLAAAVVMALMMTGAYGSGDQRRDMKRIAVAAAIAAGVVCWSALWADARAAIPLGGTVAVLLAVALWIARWCFDRGVRRYARAYRLPVIIIGGSRHLAAPDVASMMAARGFTAVGWVGLDPKDDSVDLPVPRIGSIEELDDAVREQSARHPGLAILVQERPTATVLRAILRVAALTEVSVLLDAAPYVSGRARPRLVLRGGAAYLEARPLGPRGPQLAAKRALDIVVSGAALVLLAPLFGVIALLVRLTDGGPPVFGHERLGRMGRGFRCFKFRSMYPDAEARLHADAALWSEYVANDYKLPAHRDPRITPLGGWLRKTSLDELPQLWNVFRGDMSLVGPRPIVPKELEHYGADAALLLQVRPGVTGLWQVSGRSDVPYPERTTIELAYVENWSFWTDVGILLRTIPAVVAARGAH